MSELAALIAQLTGQSQPPAQDPALAAVKLARASIDALVLKLGQTVDAKVVGQLAAGLTQLSAGNESFVLKLETPLPQGTPVSIRVTQTPQGTPAVTVSVPNVTPHVAQPMQVQTPTAPLVEAQRAPPASTPPLAATPATMPPTSPPAPQSVHPPLPATPAPSSPAQAQPTASPVAQAASPSATAPPPVVRSTQPLPQATPTVATSAAPIPQPQSAPPLSQPAAQPLPATATQPSPSPGQPTTPSAPPSVTLSSAPAAAAPPTSSAVPPQAAAIPPAVPAPTTAATPQTTATLTPPAATPAASNQPAPSPVTPLAAQPTQPLPTHPSPYPVHAAPAATPVVAQQPPLATPAVAATRPTAPPLNLSDPAQAAARQDSAAPLLAKLATIVTAAAPSLPRPVIDMALRLLANRVDLNRGKPDAKTLEAAVLKAGVLLTPLTREPAVDSKSALLALRSTLLAFLGGDTTGPVAATERPAPPIKGEPPRAPTPQAALPDPSVDGHDTARTLLGQTDAALSRLKLLQSASQPAVDTRIDAPAPRNELRVEIPMLLGAETGILQLMVERDSKHKREPERQRGWRMRFAMNFSATGEVGADITLLGRAANIAIWAADTDTADALDALLPELAPAIQRHGLELTSLRVRRGAPQHARTAPGQLLDSAR